MELISRAEAKKRGLHKYFTGKPCANGHVAERYTQSGSCQSCIRSADKRTQLAYSEQQKEAREAKNAEMLELAEARRVALETMVVAKVRCFDADYPQIRDLAVVLMQNRYPFLRAEDAGVNRAPLDPTAGTALHKLSLHPDDVKFMQEAAQALMKARPVNMQAERQRIHGARIAAMIDQINWPAPEFVP